LLFFHTDSLSSYNKKSPVSTAITLSSYSHKNKKENDSFQHKAWLLPDSKFISNYTKKAAFKTAAFQSMSNFWNINYRI